jgi:hypothetical protein
MVRFAFAESLRSSAEGDVAEGLAKAMKGSVLDIDY